MNEETRNWLIKAFEDFTVVIHEMKLPKDEITTSMVCFHCQQFVEKLLKAYLVFYGIEFPRTHNLEFLKELCARHDEDFKTLHVGDLSRYAVEARYPEEFYIPSIEEAEECFKIAEAVKDFILRKLRIKEEEIKRWRKR